MNDVDERALRARLAGVEEALAEANETLDAIRNGDVDAVVVGGPAGQIVYTLENADRPYRVLVEQMREGAITLSSDGMLLYVNTSFARLLERPAHDLIGTNLLNHGSDRRLLKAMIEGTCARTAEVSLLSLHGAAIPVNLSIVDLNVADDTPRMLCGVVTDLTDIRRTEDALRQAQKLEAIGQLTGGVAHDFNNLLTVIRGSVELLQRPNLSEEKRARYIAAIAETSDRAARLTSQLLSFARRQALKPELFDIGGSLENVKGIVTSLSGSRIELETLMPAEPCFVMADRSQFDTAIVNLAINARDAMQGEGRIRITANTVAELPSLGGARAIRGDYMAIAVADTGSGIAPEHLERIFEPFFTTKVVGSGTGLGLSQVIGFARQSDGDVRVATKVGQGTTFTLYLPRAKSPIRLPDVVEEPRELASGEGVCVLVVEDNPDVGTFATQALKELGYDSVLASGADAALAELQGASQRFQIVFSDVIMPGTTGIELARIIKTRYPDIPVVLASGYSEVLAQGGGQGFELMHKPYSIDELSRAIRRAIPEHAG